jgi:hypothetical protein
LAIGSAAPKLASILWRARRPSICVVLLLQRQALGHRQRRAEAGLDTVAGAQAVDLRLDPLGQLRISLDHVRPDHVAADRWAFDAAQHRAHLRAFAPGGVAVPGVFVLQVACIGTLVDAHQPRMLGVAADHRMVLERSEAPRQGHVLGARKMLIAQEQHLVLQQQRAQLGEQRVVARGLAEFDAGQFGADAAGQGFDADGCHWGFRRCRRRAQAAVRLVASSRMNSSARGHSP